MAEQPSSALTMLTECFSTEHIEDSARRTGFVKRASKMTGQLFLALVTFGVWSDAHTTLAPLAAQVTQLDEGLTSSPEAIYQRLHKSQANQQEDDAMQSTRISFYNTINNLACERGVGHGQRASNECCQDDACQLPPIRPGKAQQALHSIAANLRSIPLVPEHEIFARFDVEFRHVFLSLGDI